jgi:hypothetical protein
MSKHSVPMVVNDYNANILQNIVRQYWPETFEYFMTFCR